MRMWWVLVICIMLSVLIYSVFTAWKAAQEDRARTMYLNECASCHGGRLEGQSGWKSDEFGRDVLAPSLNNSGHAWQHTDAYLTAVMRNVSGSMKGHVEGGFNEGYDVEDYETLLKWIKSHWSDSYRLYQRRLSKVGNRD